MSFYGSAFSYNNIQSESFGLRIAELDASGVNESMGSSSMEILEQKIYRRATPFFFGATPSPKLSFEMSAFSENEIDADLFQLIQKAYFSSRTYQKLYIDQVDMQSTYFNCILLDPQIVRVGNLLHGIRFTVSCDAPFAWGWPKTTTYNYTQTIVDSTETFLNTSDDTGGYLYPNLTITLNNIDDDLSITNLDDNNRVFAFTGISANEVLTINNGLQTISSSTGLRRLSNFNKHFLRLVPGRNRLRIQGNIASIQMVTQNIVKKIGG
jgi:phage-related protein